MNANLLDGVSPVLIRGVSLGADGEFSFSTYQGSYNERQLVYELPFVGKLDANQTFHFGVSAIADGGTSELFVKLSYSDSAGNTNKAVANIIVTTTYARYEASLVIPSGMTVGDLLLSRGSNAKHIKIQPPTLSYGGPVTLASSAHTPYATQDHVSVTYATKASLKVTDESVKAEVSARAQTDRNVADLSSRLTQTANSLTSEISDRKSAITTVTGLANAAQSTADAAKTSASSAVSTANAASSTASAAKSTAQTAASDAATAKTNASSAKSTAQTAASDAATAKTNASAAVSTANSANTKSESAVSTANSAVSTANAAQSTADNAAKQANLYIIGLGDAGAVAKWIHLGTLTSAGDSSSATIAIVFGNGYNGSAGQNSTLTITIKDGWQSTPSAVNACGVTVMRENCDNALVDVLAQSATVYDVWVYVPWAYSAGRYSISGDYAAWKHSGATQKAEPATSATQVKQDVAYRLADATKAQTMATENRSSIKQLSDSITAEVTARTKTDGMVSDLSSRLTQTANSLTSEISDRKSAITTVTGLANAAQSTADAAKTSASNAVSTANSASSSAANAVETANAASSAASAASTAAGKASTDAAAAVKTANSASSTASGAVTTANEAAATANAASDTATAAQTMAIENQSSIKQLSTSITAEVTARTKTDGMVSEVSSRLTQTADGFSASIDRLSDTDKKVNSWFGFGADSSGNPQLTMGSSTSPVVGVYTNAGLAYKARSGATLLELDGASRSSTMPHVHADDVSMGSWQWVPTQNGTHFTLQWIGG